MYFGSVCHGALPQMVRPAAGRNQGSQDLTKHLLPFHLLPAFTDMDHIHKVLVGPGFSPGSSGPGSGLKRKHSSCGVCRLRFNSEAQASSHYNGTKHAKKMKALDTPDSKIKTPEPVVKETTSQIPPLSPRSAHPSCSSDSTSGEPSSPAPSSDATPSNGGSPDLALPSCPGAKDQESQRHTEVDTAPEDETEEERAIRLLYCSLCKVAVNSASQLQAHNSGTKHKTMLEARSGGGAIKSFPRSGVKAKLAAAAAAESSTGLQNKTFHCEICDVHVNSETQLKQHISSRRHKDRAAGKPSKPKFSPYSPNQRQQHSFHTIRLALRKNQDLTKPLTSCLLQQQISVAAAAAMATLPPFPLRPAANSNLFQTQPLAQTLLPPPPGHGAMCSTHGPVLFAPY